jgi:hypothetical protein
MTAGFWGGEGLEGLGRALTLGVLRLRLRMTPLLKKVITARARARATATATARAIDQSLRLRLRDGLRQSGTVLWWAMRPEAEALGYLHALRRQIRATAMTVGFWGGEGLGGLGRALIACGSG